MYYCEGKKEKNMCETQILEEHLANVITYIKFRTGIVYYMDSNIQEMSMPVPLPILHSTRLSRILHVFLSLIAISDKHSQNCLLICIVRSEK